MALTYRIVRYSEGNTTGFASEKSIEVTDFLIAKWGDNHIGILGDIAGGLSDGASVSEIRLMADGKGIIARYLDSKQATLVSGLREAGDTVNLEWKGNDLYVGGRKVRTIGAMFEDSQGRLTPVD